MYNVKTFMEIRRNLLSLICIRRLFRSASWKEMITVSLPVPSCTSDIVRSQDQHVPLPGFGNCRNTVDGQLG